MSRLTKAFTPQIVSANDLLVGDVVYLTSGETWTREITDAAVAETKAEAEGLLTAATAQQDRVVGPYLVDIELGGRPQPLHFRERYRDMGPSNRLDLGRQAERVR